MKGGRSRSPLARRDGTWHGGMMEGRGGAAWRRRAGTRDAESRIDEDFRARTHATCARAGRASSMLLRPFLVPLPSFLRSSIAEVKFSSPARSILLHQNFTNERTSHMCARAEGAASLMVKSDRPPHNRARAPLAAALPLPSPVLLPHIIDLN